MAALQAISHPNVVRLKRCATSAYSDGAGGGPPREVLLLELELCSGGELFDFVLHGGAFPEGAARHACRELFGALAHCHAVGVFHRDLKPENILVGTSPGGGFTLKVADWGLAVLDEARHLGPGGGASTEGLCRTPVGTRAYQAPEVIALPPGRLQGYDATKADAWSAACVTFILLAGSPPFTQATNTDWWFNAVRLKRRDDFWAAHQRPPTPAIALGARAFLDRAFTADPGERASVADLCADPWLCGAASDPTGNALQASEDRRLCSSFMARAAAKAAAEQEREKAAALAGAAAAAAQRDVVFKAVVARSAGADSGAGSSTGGDASLSSSSFAPPPFSELDTARAQPPLLPSLLTDESRGGGGGGSALTALAAGLAGVGLGDAAAAAAAQDKGAAAVGSAAAHAAKLSAAGGSGLDPVAASTHRSVDASSGESPVVLGGFGGSGGLRGGRDRRRVFTGCDPDAVLGALSGACAAQRLGVAANGPFALLVTGDLTAAASAAAAASAGASGLPPAPPSPPERGNSSGSVVSFSSFGSGDGAGGDGAGGDDAGDDGGEFDASPGDCGNAAPAAALAAAAVATAEGGLALRLWRLPDAADKGVCVLEASSAAAAGGVDPWALAAFWAHLVLPSLAALGCPAAAAALRAVDGASSPSGTPASPPFFAARLPPPRDDDPTFNSELRAALAAAATDAAGRVRDDAQDDVF